MAEHTASIDLQSKFLSQFLNNPGEAADRKYLVDGYLLTIITLGTCICCGHGFIDETNTNWAISNRNATKQAQYDAQCFEDKAIWATEGAVLTNKGGIVQQECRHNKPKYEQMVIHCHSNEFG